MDERNFNLIFYKNYLQFWYRRVSLELDQISLSSTLCRTTLFFFLVVILIAVHNSWNSLEIDKQLKKADSLEI